MNESVMFSIQPEPCKNIANEQKEWEFRTKPPKTKPPYKGYIYCTKGKGMLWILAEKERQYNKPKIADVFTAGGAGPSVHKANGKVIGEFICDEVVEVVQSGFVNPFAINRQILEKGRLSNKEFLSYTDHYRKDLYALHISQLVIYDKPKELGEFYVKCKGLKHGECTDVRCGLNEPYFHTCGNGGYKPLANAFQSWGYIEV